MNLQAIQSLNVLMVAVLLTATSPTTASQLPHEDQDAVKRLAMTTDTPSVKPHGLSPVAQNMAEQLELMPLIEQLQASNNAPESDVQAQLKRLKLQQIFDYKVSLAQLEVRDATARIERELAYMNRWRGVLQDRRDRAIKLNSIENVVASGGISEIGNARSFAANQVSNNLMQLIAGSATIGLGTLALMQQGGGKHPMEMKPNMLAQLFNMQHDSDSTYPPFVWKYLNRAPVGRPQTRLQTLISGWQRIGTIPKDLNSQPSKRRLALITNSVPNAKATINLFDDRSDMMFDLRSEIFQADRDLLELMMNIHQVFE